MLCCVSLDWDMKIRPVVILLALLVFILCISRKQISNFVANTAYGSGSLRTNVMAANDDKCASHCVTDSDGRVMNDYDCCQCRATGSSGFGEDPGYDKRFRICMCQQAGRRDFCYRPVTNFILSQ